MDEVLRSQQVVRTVPSGMECRVLAYLGAGNQGQVYRAALGTSEVALKWYLPGAAGRRSGPRWRPWSRAGPATGASCGPWSWPRPRTSPGSAT